MKAKNFIFLIIFGFSYLNLNAQETKDSTENLSKFSLDFLFPQAAESTDFNFFVNDSNIVSLDIDIIPSPGFAYDNWGSTLYNSQLEYSMKIFTPGNEIDYKMNIIKPDSLQNFRMPVYKR